MATTIHVREDELHPIPFRADRHEQRLRGANLALGLVLAVQAVAVVLVADPEAVTVTTGVGVPLGSAGSVPVRLLVAASLGAAALSHLLTVPPGGFRRYVRQLRRGRAWGREAGHALATVPLVLAVFLVAGLTDRAALVATAGATGAVAALGAPRDPAGRSGGDPGHPALVVASLAAASPWVALVLEVVDRGSRPAVPALVVAAAGVSFALVAWSIPGRWRTSRRIGRRRRSERTEALDLAVGLVARTATAWLLVAALGR